MPAYVERLKPASRGGLKPHLGKPAGEVSGGGVGPGGAGGPALEPIVSEKLDVVEEAGRLHQFLSRQGLDHRRERQPQNCERVTKHPGIIEGLLTAARSSCRSEADGQTPPAGETYGRGLRGPPSRSGYAYSGWEPKPAQWPPHGGR